MEDDLKKGVELIAYKKIRYWVISTKERQRRKKTWSYPDRGDYEEAIAVLKIPKDANRVGKATGKCRASRAIVLAIYPLKTTPSAERKNKITNYSTRKVQVQYKTPILEGFSGSDHEFVYKVGETVKPEKKFDTSHRQCASGIHFFLEMDAAINWAL